MFFPYSYRVYVKFVIIYDYLSPSVVVPWVLSRACNSCGKRNRTMRFIKVHFMKRTRKRIKRTHSHLLLSDGGIIRPWDLRICTSLTCLASLCTLGNGGTDFFVRPQPRHWHWYSTSLASIKNISHNLISRAVQYRAIATVLTARSVCKRRLHVTVLLRDAVIDAIRHVLELPVAVVPAAFVHDVLRGVRAHRGRALQLAAVLVHLDSSFFPCLLLSRRQFPPLERKWFLRFTWSIPLCRS